MPQAIPAANAAVRKPYAVVPKPGTTATEPVSKARRIWNNFLRVAAKPFGIDLPLYNKEGLPVQENLLEFLETAPPEVTQAMNDFLEKVRPQIEKLVTEYPNLTFEDLQNFSPEQLGVPNFENLEKYIPNLAQTDFAPIAAEAERRFQQETVPGILNQLTGLGQTGRSSAFQGALGRAGQDLQSKLAALESAHNLERGKLQLGQGELGGRLYEAASKRAGVLGGLRNEQGRLGLGKAEALGRLQLGQQSNIINQKANVLSALTGQMNRPTTSYAPPGSPDYLGQAMSGIASPLAKGLGSYLFGL